jgi:hypothetical protein
MVAPSPRASAHFACDSGIVGSGLLKEAEGVGEGLEESKEEVQYFQISQQIA